MSTLVYLNELRAVVGKKPLKAWKESKQKLFDAIAALENTDLGEYSLKEAIAEMSIDDFDAKKIDGASQVIFEEPKEVIGELPALKKSTKSKPTVIRAKGAYVDDLRKATKQEVAALQEKIVEKAASGDTVTLVDIARELNINPRVARAKMRRVDMSKLPADTVVGKHTYSSKHKDDVIAALKHDFRKK